MQRNPFDWTRHPTLIQHRARRTRWLFRKVLTIASGQHCIKGEVLPNGSIVMFYNAKLPSGRMMEANNVA